MAWTKVGETTFRIIDAAGDPQAVTLPDELAGPIAEGDIVIVVHARDLVISVAAGGEIVTSGYTDIEYDETANAPGRQVAYKIMGETPDTTVSFSDFHTGTESSAGVIQVWRGVDTTTPLDVAVPTPTDGLSTDPDPPAITPTTNGCLIFAVGLLDDDDDTAVTAPTGYTNLVNHYSAEGGTNGATVMMASKEQATAAEENPAAFTNVTSDNWTALTFALRPGEPSARLLPSVITDLPLDVSQQNPDDQGGLIIIEPPAGEGELPDERTLLLIHSREPIENITAAPAGATLLLNEGDVLETNAWLVAYIMPVGNIEPDQYEFTTTDVFTTPRIRAYALRVRDVHPTDPLAATPVSLSQEGTDPEGSPDGLVRAPAITPDAEALKSIRFGMFATRREGVWTVDENLTLIFPAGESESDHAAGYEEWDAVTEAPLRTAEHDNPIDGVTSFYGRTGASLLLQGAPDYERPGPPILSSVAAKSWDTVSGTVAKDDTPGATTTIKVYARSATGALDPDNDTLLETINSPGASETFFGTGLNAETSYRIYAVATNAEGDKFSLPTEITTWSQAAYVIDTSSPVALEVPLTIPAGETAQGIEIRVGAAALVEADLITTPELLVEIYDSNPTLIGSETFTGLSLIEDGVLQSVAFDDPVTGEETLSVELTNTGRTVAVWGLEGVEGSPPDAPVFVSASTDQTGETIAVTFDKAMQDPAGKHAQFTYKVNGGSAQNFSAAASGAASTDFVLTTSGTAIAYGDTVTLNYTAGTVQSTDDGVLATFANQTVTNNTVLPSDGGASAGAVPTRTHTITTVGKTVGNLAKGQLAKLIRILK